jgi:hypothetical protein
VKVPWKALALCVPIAAGGGWIAIDSHARIGRLSGELAAFDEAGRAEGASYVRTLQGAHAERQLEAMNRRREVARELFAARRNRLLGLLAMGGAVLGGWAAVVLGRISREVDEQRRLFEE